MKKSISVIMIVGVMFLGGTTSPHVAQAETTMPDSQAELIALIQELLKQINALLIEVQNQDQAVDTESKEVTEDIKVEIVTDTKDKADDTKDAASKARHGIFDESFVLLENADIADDDEGVFTFSFELTAFGDDIFLEDSVVYGDSLIDAQTFNASAAVTVFGGGSELLESELTAVEFNLSSSADEEGSGRYRIDEGSTETFTIKAVVDPSTSDFYSIQLHGVAYSESDSAPSTFQSFGPANDFETASEFIN